MATLASFSMPHSPSEGEVNLFAQGHHVTNGVDERSVDWESAESSENHDDLPPGSEVLDKIVIPALYLWRPSPSSWALFFPARCNNSDPIQAARHRATCRSAPR